MLKYNLLKVKTNFGMKSLRKKGGKIQKMRETKAGKNEKGITLVALVITVIVVLVFYDRKKYSNLVSFCL